MLSFKRTSISLLFASASLATTAIAAPATFYSNTLIFDSLSVQATPVPEPTSYAMFLLGLTVLMAVGRQRKAAAKPAVLPSAMPT